MKANRLFLPALAVFTAALTGCVAFRSSRHHQASSVVQFLYPGKNEPFIEPGIPTLRLPLRVGIAFVPSVTTEKTPNWFDQGVGFTEAQKAELMGRIATKFKALPFVQSIEILPETYLRPGGGFDNLDQLRSLLGVDVVALISYDQAQNSSDTAWSLAYWTIVGAYLVPAQKNDTHTLMEAVVYDIPSRRLLFRAPGASAVTGHSTMVRSPADMRADSARGLVLAADDLTENLQRELDAFKVRLKDEPQSVHIEHKPGYSGGGGMGRWFFGALVTITAISQWHRR
ncbi:MAG: rhombotarget lipoprotein, partial [Lacunisphaera sp.]